MTETRATVSSMTTPSDAREVPPPQGTRARASGRERPLRCGRPKVEDGRPCRRDAGRDTDHFGEGPCSKHDDGTWQRVSFADNAEAQEAFLAAVAADPEKPTRVLIEPLGYRRRDVRELEASDGEFAARVIEVRGYSPERIRHELANRAFGAKGSDRLLELLARMHLPEGEKLRQSRLDGQLDVRGVPYVDFSKLDERDMAELHRILTKGAPSPDELPRDGRPALELVSGAS